MTLSVTQFGKILPKEKYTWDEEAKVFSSKELNLVIECYVKHTTFNTGRNCTFITGDNCIFKTSRNCSLIAGDNCIFNVGYGCDFNTGHGCNFDTGSDCIFETGNDCNFDAGCGCIFDTSSDCNFSTGDTCTFTTKDNCTFTTSHGCTFTTGTGCIIVRRDIFEVIKIPKKTTIKLNNYRIKGFIKVKPTKTITINNKAIEVSAEQFDMLLKNNLICI